MIATQLLHSWTDWNKLMKSNKVSNWENYFTVYAISLEISLLFRFLDSSMLGKCEYGECCTLNSCHDLQMRISLQSIEVANEWNVGISHFDLWVFGNICTKKQRTSLVKSSELWAFSSRRIHGRVMTIEVYDNNLTCDNRYFSDNWNVNSRQSFYWKSPKETIYRNEPNWIHWRYDWQGQSTDIPF